MKLKWKKLCPASKKWIRGWVLVMDKDLNQKVVFHDQIDDSMILYFRIPNFLTKEQKVNR